MNEAFVCWPIVRLENYLLMKLKQITRYFHTGEKTASKLFLEVKMYI